MGTGVDIKTSIFNFQLFRYGYSCNKAEQKRCKKIFLVIYIIHIFRLHSFRDISENQKLLTLITHDVVYKMAMAISIPLYHACRPWLMIFKYLKLFLQSCTTRVCKAVTTILHVISIFLLKALVVKGLKFWDTCDFYGYTRGRFHKASCGKDLLW